MTDVPDRSEIGISNAPYSLHHPGWQYLRVGGDRRVAGRVADGSRAPSGAGAPRPVTRATRAEREGPRVGTLHQGHRQQEREGNQAPNKTFASAHHQTSCEVRRQRDGPAARRETAQRWCPIPPARDAHVARLPVAIRPCRCENAKSTRLASPSASGDRIVPRHCRLRAASCRDRAATMPRPYSPRGDELPVKTTPFTRATSGLLGAEDQCRPWTGPTGGVTANTGCT